MKRKSLSMYYKGWNVFGGSETDLKDKCRKIDRGDTDGFKRIPTTRLDNLEKFIKSIKEPIEDLVFSQNNPDFCKVADSSGRIKADSIKSIIEAYKELIK